MEPNVFYVGLKKPYHVKVERDVEVLNVLKAAVAEAGGIAEFVNRDGLYVILPKGAVLSDAWMSLNAEGQKVLQFFNKRSECLTRTHPVPELYDALQGGRCRSGLVLLDIFERTPTLFAIVANPRVYPKMQLLRMADATAKRLYQIDHSICNSADHFGTAKKGIVYPILGSFPEKLLEAFKQNALFFNEWVHQCLVAGAYVNPLDMGGTVGLLSWEQYREIFFGAGEGATLQDMLRGPQFQSITPAVLRGANRPAVGWHFSVDV